MLSCKELVARSSDFPMGNWTSADNWRCAATCSCAGIAGASSARCA